MHTMPGEAESISTTDLLRGGRLDEILAKVAHCGARFTLTRYRKPVAMLVPVPERIVSDPNDVLAERMENSAKNPVKTPRERSVPLPAPSKG